MSRTRLMRWSAALASVLALSAVAAQASHQSVRRRPRLVDAAPIGCWSPPPTRTSCLTFNARNPDRIQDIQAITGLPAGVTLRGIDFRPETGDLYGVGSDSVVYRVNPSDRHRDRRRPGVHAGAARQGVRRRLQPGRRQDPRRQRRPAEPAPERRRGHRADADADLNPGMPRSWPPATRTPRSASRSRPRRRCTWSTRRATRCSRRTRRTTARSPTRARLQDRRRRSTPASTSRATTTSAS